LAVKVTFLTNACCIYESGGFRLLCDPWLTPGAFGTWMQYPPLKAKPDDFCDVDGIYISHCHQDHLDPETLKHFRKDIPIFILQDKLSISAKILSRLGFTKVQSVAPKRQVNFHSFKMTFFEPWTKHPHHDCEIGNVVDSAMLIEADGKKILNCNDNTLSLEAAEAFYQEHGAVDIAQLNSNGASFYPACFRNLTHREKLAEKERILEQQTGHMVAVARALRVKMVQPFAGAFRLSYGLERLNQYLPVWDPEVIAIFCQERGLDALVLAEGESYDL
jgi:UDP-MurNAc hydroxylase